MKKLYTAIDARLVDRIELLDRMTTSARSRLARHLAEHCWVGSYDSTCLSVITDNAAFSMPIYYQQAEILKQLNEEFGGELKCRLRKMTIRVMREPMPAGTASRVGKPGASGTGKTALPEAGFVERR